MKAPFLPPAVSQVKIISVLWYIWKYYNKVLDSIFSADMSHHAALWDSYIFNKFVYKYIYI